MKLKTFIRQTKRKINYNLLYFVIFSLILIIHSFLELKFLSWRYFLSDIIWNSIWREIILWWIIYFYWYKFIKKIELYKEKNEINRFSNTLSNFFLSFLWILAFQSIFWQAIFWFDMANYSIWTFLLWFIEKMQYMLVILAIVFGSLIFYVNREKIENLEEENGEEELSEEKRKLEFEEKFPILNKTFIIWWICKWFWKEWLKYSLGLIIIILLWLWLRFTAAIHLNTVIVEEEFHYIPAKNLVES